MLNYSDIAALVTKARQHEVSWLGATVKVVLPDDAEVAEVARSLSIDRESDQLSGLNACRALVAKSIVGWEGIVAGMFVPNAGDDKVECSEETAKLLLTERIDFATAIYGEMAKAVGTRAKAFAEARKKFARG